LTKTGSLLTRSLSPAINSLATLLVFDSTLISVTPKKRKPVFVL